MHTPVPGRLAAALLLALAACAPRPTADAPEANDPADPAPRAPQAGGLATSLQVETFPDSVRFVLTVTNAGTAPVTVVFPSGQSYDFVVRADGRELWRWSADMGFTQAVREVPLAPGQTQTFAESWRPPAGTGGQFTAVAQLTSSSHPVERTATFRLP